MRLCLQLFMRKWPKSSFRRPMEGRGFGKDKTNQGLYLWPMSFGELDEEVVEHGRKVPKRDRVPQIMVPNLQDCHLKPYVTYRAEGEYEPAIQSKDLFDTFYAPTVEAEATNVPLEDIPETEKSSNSLLALFSRKKVK